MDEIRVRHPFFGTVYLGNPRFVTVDGKEYVVGEVGEPSPLGYGHGPLSTMNFPVSCIWPVPDQERR